MRKPANISSKTKFWEEHIKAWPKSGVSQADYCLKHKISVTAFSKWKLRFYPSWKHKNKIYKPKSKYYKFTKLSDETIEKLMLYFIVGISAKNSAEYSGISVKSVYNYYNDFRLALIDGALLYPQLFFGVGMILTLGPPHSPWKAINHIGRVFSNLKARSFQSTEKGKLRSKIQIVYLMLLYNSLYQWEEGEIFLSRQTGYEIFYRFIYSKHYQLDSNNWNEEIYLKLLREVTATTVARSNWDYWANKQNHVSVMSEKQWAAIYQNRKNRAISEEGWINPMLHDLKWVMQKHRRKAQQAKLSNYWSEYIPDRDTVNQASINLFGSLFEENS